MELIINNSIKNNNNSNNSNNNNNNNNNNNKCCCKCGKIIIKNNHCTGLECLFWKVIKNKYLFLYIFKNLEEMDYCYRDLNNYYFGNRIKFIYIKSLRWMVKKNLFSLIKDKLISNKPIKFDYDALVMFVQGCNEYDTLVLFFEKYKDEILKNNFNIDMGKLALSNSNMNLLKYILTYNCPTFSEISISTLEYSFQNSDRVILNGLVYIYFQQIIDQANKESNSGDNISNNCYSNNINSSFETKINNSIDLYSKSVRLILHNNNISENYKLHYLKNVQVFEGENNNKTEFEKIEVYKFFQIQTFQLLYHVLSNDYVKVEDIKLNTYLSYIDSKLFSPITSSGQLKCYLLLLKMIKNNCIQFSRLPSQFVVQVNGSTLKELKKTICIESDQNSTYLNYFQHYDEIIPEAPASIIYFYTFSNFSVNGLNYILSNKKRFSNINNIIPKALKTRLFNQYYRIHNATSFLNSSSLPNSSSNPKKKQSFYNSLSGTSNLIQYSSTSLIEKLKSTRENINRIELFIKIYKNQNVFEFRYWQVFIKYSLNILSIDTVELLFQELDFGHTYFLNQQYSFNDFGKIQLLLKNVFQKYGKLEKKDPNKEYNINTLYEIIDNIKNNSVSIHPNHQILINNAPITSCDNLNFIYNNLKVFNFGFFLVYPRLDRIKVAIKFSQLFEGVPSFLIFHWSLLKSIFVNQNINKLVKCQELIFKSFIQNKNTINPFNNEYYSSSYKEISNLLNQQCNYNYNDDHQLPQPYHLLNNNYNKNFNNEYLDKSNDLLELNIKQSIKILTNEMENIQLKPIIEYQEIINHLGSNHCSKPNSIIFNGLLYFIYYQYQLKSIKQLSFNFINYQQDLLELVFILLFNNHIGKAVHLFNQIKNFDYIHISHQANNRVNYLLNVKGYRIQLKNGFNLKFDSSLISDEIIEMINSIVTKVPSYLLSSFTPLIQHLFNQLIVSTGSNLSIISSVYNLLNNEMGIPIVLGFYHQFYLLYYKDPRLAGYILSKSSENYNQLFTSQNNYNGPITTSSVLNQKCQISYFPNIVPSVPKAISTEGNIITINITLNSICKSTFEKIYLLLNFMFSKLPKFNKLYNGLPDYIESNSITVTDSVNDDIVYCLAINQVKTAIYLVNQSSLIINFETFIKLTKYSSINQLAGLEIYKENLIIILSACIKNKRKDIIHFIFNNHYDSIYSFINYEDLFYQKLPSLSIKGPNYNPMEPSPISNIEKIIETIIKYDYTTSTNSFIQLFKSLYDNNIYDGCDILLCHLRKFSTLSFIQISNKLKSKSRSKYTIITINNIKNIVNRDNLKIIMKYYKNYNIRKYKYK